MASLPVEIEIDRLMNLIRGFGWEEVEKKITDTEVVMTIKKDIVKELTPES
jgi:hypothetical protein